MSFYPPPAITTADVNEAVSNSLKDVTGMYIFMQEQRERGLIKILSPPGLRGCVFSMLLCVESNDSRSQSELTSSICEIN